MEIRVIGVDAVRGDSSEEIRGADPGLDLIEFLEIPLVP